MRRYAKKLKRTNRVMWRKGVSSRRLGSAASVRIERCSLILWFQQPLDFILHIDIRRMSSPYDSPGLIHEDKCWQNCAEVLLNATIVVR